MKTDQRFTSMVSKWAKATQLFGQASQEFACAGPQGLLCGSQRNLPGYWMMCIYSRSLSAEEVNNLYVHEKGNYVLGGRETAGLVSGNPGGYFSMTEAVSGMAMVVVLPDLTEGKPIAGFSVEMDLRMGNGTGDAQADGFSINFARADLEVSSRMDPMLQDLAGGSAHPNNAAVNGQPETGTQTD